jgi:hypothetical protein
MEQEAEDDATVSKQALAMPHGRAVSVTSANMLATWRIIVWIQIQYRLMGSGPLC